MTALCYQYLWFMYHFCEYLSGLQILLNLMEDLTKFNYTWWSELFHFVLKISKYHPWTHFRAHQFYGVDTWLNLLIIILAFIQVLHRFMKGAICVILLGMFRKFIAFNCSQGEYLWLHGFLRIPTDRRQSADVCLSPVCVDSKFTGTPEYRDVTTNFTSWIVVLFGKIFI